MEDIGTIIWVLVIAGIALSNLGSKARKARGKESAQPHDEAWPASEEHPEAPARPETPRMPEILGMPRRVTPKAVPQQSTEGSSECHSDKKTLSKLNPSIEQHGKPSLVQHRAFETDARRIAPTTAQHGAMASVSPEPDAKTNGSNLQERNRGIEAILGEEFDLRRAVIYSEILKPKFDE